jgi:hypothetical protein
MARAIHRHRHIRLASTRDINNRTRTENRPRKAKESARRDAAMKAAIKANKTGDFNPAVKSWITRQLDKAWRQVTKDDIKSLTACAVAFDV